MPDRTRGIRSVSGRTPSFWWGCGVFLLAILPFLPSAGYPFLVEWDDGRFVLFNDRLLPSQENALHLATHTFQTLYTPLPMLSLMVDRFFFGTLPAGYHWHNLLLHGVSALLLFLIFRRLEVRDWIAAAGALLWAVLPARVESVAWIAERKDLTAGVFAFAAFWLFLRAAAAGKASGVSAVLLFLAGVSKPSTLPLFGVMVLYLYCRSGRWSSIRLALPQIVSALAATAIVTGISMIDLAGGDGNEPEKREMSRQERLAYFKTIACDTICPIKTAHVSADGGQPIAAVVRDMAAGAQDTMPDMGDFDFLTSGFSLGGGGANLNYIDDDLDRSRRSGR